MLKYIYITIGWIPGKVLFVKKLRKVIDTSTTNMVDVAKQLITETVARGVKKYGVTDPETFAKELYFEIYEHLDEDSVAIAYSDNAPASPNSPKG